MSNRVCKLFNIQFPIVQAGMVWCSGWKLAASVCNSGGLGTLGAGSMYPDLLQEHIQKLKSATSQNFAVNIPLMSKYADEHLQVVIKNNVPIVITSAGNPLKSTSKLKEAGITVAHVVANVKNALKSEEAGVDAIIAEGFEAGGHNGREETTTQLLINLIRKTTDLPLLAAGGIHNAQSMMAAMVLGADGVQIGSRFAACRESSAHEIYKSAVLEAQEGSTMLTLKQLMPVRLIKNHFYQQIQEAEYRGASKSEFQQLLGSGRAKMGIFEGDIENGELEIGQVSAIIDKSESATDIMLEIKQAFYQLKKTLLDDEKFLF